MALGIVLDAQHPPKDAFCAVIERLRFLRPSGIFEAKPNVGGLDRNLRGASETQRFRFALEFTAIGFATRD